MKACLAEMIFKLKKEEILEVMFYFEKGNVIGVSSVAYTPGMGMIFNR